MQSTDVYGIISQKQPNPLQFTLPGTLGPGVIWQLGFCAINMPHEVVGSVGKQPPEIGQPEGTGTPAVTPTWHVHSVALANVGRQVKPGMSHMTCSASPNN